MQSAAVQRRPKTRRLYRGLLDRRCTMYSRRGKRLPRGKLLSVIGETRFGDVLDVDQGAHQKQGLPRAWGDKFNRDMTSPAARNVSTTLIRRGFEFELCSSLSCQAERDFSLAVAFRGSDRRHAWVGATLRIGSRLSRPIGRRADCESAPNNDPTLFTANTLNLKPIVEFSTKSDRFSKLTPCDDPHGIEMTGEIRG